ncbi:MAG TPA: SEC-C metal-binding domain-containing protein [Planctomycetota bacterium]|nr:SEC-C metal-binding domain-containing protein [Planctomycetota bacterium]
MGAALQLVTDSGTLERLVSVLRAVNRDTRESVVVGEITAISPKLGDSFLQLRKHLGKVLAVVALLLQILQYVQDRREPKPATAQEIAETVQHLIDALVERQQPPRTQVNVNFNLGGQPPVDELKPARKDPCPCGSGKKYKNCHGK